MKLSIDDLRALLRMSMEALYRNLMPIVHLCVFQSTKGLIVMNSGSRT